MKKIEVDFNIDGELPSFISFKLEIFSQLRLQGGLGAGLVVRAWVVTLRLFHGGYLIDGNANSSKKIINVHTKFLVKLTAHESSYESRNKPYDTIFHHITFFYETNENVI